MKISVLMVTGVYAPEINGAVMQCMKVTKILKNKVNFNILTTTKNKHFLNFRNIFGVRVYRFLVYEHAIFNIFQIFNIFLFFVKNKSKFDIVHLHGFSSRSALIVIFSKFFGKKVILKMSSFGHDDFDSVEKNRLLNYCYSLIDCYIGIAPIFDKDYLKISGKYHRITNGVDTKLFSPVESISEKKALRIRLGLPSSINLILFIGHFSREKSAIDLLDAWLKLQNKQNSFQSGIVFIGSTDENNFEVEAEVVRNIKTKAEKFINNRIFFIEKTNRIEEYFQAVDLYVLSSTREGMPNTLLESMSCALPAISSNLHGITDWVIKDGFNGFLYEPGDIDKLCSLLHELLSDVDLRIEVGINARKTIQLRFDILATSAMIYKLYNKVLIK